MGAVKDLKQQVVDEVLDSLKYYILTTDRIDLCYGSSEDFVKDFREFFERKENKNG